MSDNRPPLGPALMQEFGGDKEAAYRYLDELREANEAAKARAEQRRKDEAAAQQAKAQAQRDAANAAELERVKAQAKAGFVGSASEFEKAWPAIKQAYQERQALNAISDMDALMAEKRRQIRSQF